MGIFELIRARGIVSEFLAIPPFFCSTQFVDEGLEVASLGRKSEFAAGRLAAAKALAEFGVAAEVIPRSEKGFPVWPSGSVGSISHSSTHACAVASRSNTCESLGLDIEPQSSIDRLAKLRNQFLTASEAYMSHEQAFITFSAKEALFKMLYPLTGEFFGFEAATVQQIDDGALTTELNESVGPFAKGTSFQTLFDFYEDHIVSVCMLARDC